MRSAPFVARRAAPWITHAGLAAGLAAFVLSGCGNGDSTSKSGQVHGTVRNADSGKPLSGVHVEFTSDTLDKATAKTDSHGKYAIFVESRSPHGRIEAHKSGYADKVLSVYLDATEVQVDVNLEHD